MGRAALVSRFVLTKIGRQRRSLIGQELIERGAEGIEIRPRPKLVVALRHLFAWRITWGIADGRTSRHTTLGIALFARTKVDQLNTPLLVEHDIARFDVKVPDTCSMDGCQSIQDLTQIVPDHLFREALTH